ncbi:MAG: hypothetical protein A2293_10025 [Elusimicrobia bacterium RIFOXYB2_FULL_49_7]|nr:MAG: hypothetical protein A2293_10025 [Elusimicrobia bacterium RIFOXYB2_FULL_49_7]
MLNTRIIGYFSMSAALFFFAGGALYIYFHFYHGWTERVVYAENIGNLKLENPIKVGGLAVGVVQSIAREGTEAKLTISLREEVALRTDYSLLNMDIGLMGDRALILNPGDTGSLLASNEPLRARFIPGIAEGIRNADTLKIVILNLKELIQRYSSDDPRDPTLFINKFKSVLRVLEQSTRSLEAMVTGNEAKISRVILETASLSTELKKNVDRARPQVEAGISKTRELSAQSLILLDKIMPMVDELARLVDETADQKNIIGRVVEDRETYNKIMTTIKTIRRLLQTAEEEGIGLDVDIF